MPSHNSRFETIGGRLDRSRPGFALIDADAFIAIYDDLSAALVRYFMRRTLNAEVSADLTAETFAAALRSRGSFTEGGDPQAWVFGIARHQLSAYFRRGRVERSARRRLAIATPALSEGGHDELWRLIDDGRVDVAMQTALGSLPPDQRHAVLLRIVDELEYDEIATLVGCSAQAARARVSRGLRTMRATLGQIPKPMAWSDDCAD